MESGTLYHTLLWRTVRALALERDADRCTVQRLLGGRCSEGSLHVHHLVPVEDGGDVYDLDNLGTTCAAHHPQWEAIRRYMVEAQIRRREDEERWRCPHRHVSAEAREQCERRRRRQLARRERLVA